MVPLGSLQGRVAWICPCDSQDHPTNATLPWECSLSNPDPGHGVSLSVTQSTQTSASAVSMRSHGASGTVAGRAAVLPGASGFRLDHDPAQLSAYLPANSPHGP